MQTLGAHSSIDKMRPQESSVRRSLVSPHATVVHSTRLHAHTIDDDVVTCELGSYSAFSRVPDAIHAGRRSRLPLPPSSVTHPRRGAHSCHSLQSLQCRHTTFNTAWRHTSLCPRVDLVAEGRPPLHPLACGMGTPPSRSRETPNVRLRRRGANSSNCVRLRRRGAQTFFRPSLFRPSCTWRGPRRA